MKVADCARRLEVSAAVVYRLTASGRLRHHRIGTGRGSIRISEEQLADYLAGAEKGRVEPPKLAALPAPITSRHFRLP